MKSTLSFLSFLCIVGAIATFALLVREIHSKPPTRNAEANLLWWALGLASASHLLTEASR